MSIKKTKKTRTPIIESKLFLCLYLSAFLGLLLYTGNYIFELFMIQIVIMTIPWFMIIYWAWTNEPDYSSQSYKFIESPTGRDLLKNIKQKSLWEPVLCYNPELQITVEPLSVRNFVNAVFNRFLLYSTLLPLVCLLVPITEIGIAVTQFALIVTLTVLIYYAINAFNFIRVMAHKQKLNTRFVQTSYTQSFFEKKITKLNVLLGRVYEDEEIFLWVLSHESYLLARRINDLMAKEHEELAISDEDKAFIEYSINEFIPSCIEQVEDFFKQHKDPKVAKQVFYQTLIALQWKRSIESMIKTIGKISENIDDLERDIQKKNVEALKKHVVKKDWLIPKESDIFSKNSSFYFDDYQHLEFPNLESKVIADNIVKKTLPQLIEQEKQAQNKDDLNLIREQINSTKQFVRSIAIGTDESEQRRQRLEQEEEDNPLALEKPSTSSPVRNLALANQRYLEALDKSLPIQ